jgi:phosphomannomutase
VTVTDLRAGTTGVVDLACGRGERSPGQPLPPANVVIWRAGGNARVMIRPSGTEPVLKIYAEAVWPARSRDELAAARASANEHVKRILAAAAAALEPDVSKEQQ